MQDFYNTIFMRKSVRSYSDEPLDDAVLNKIKDFAYSAEPLVASIRCSFKVFDRVETFRPFIVPAPHYLCLFSEKKEHFLMNAGFLLQQMDLYLSQKNLGSCYLGMGKPLRRETQHDELQHVMMLAFGIPAEGVHRKSKDEFNRMSIGEISTVEGGESLLEPCRLAPSASNTQPWLFSGMPDRIIISRRVFNPIKAAIYDRLNQIDTGIALCHLAQSAQHLGKKAVFSFQMEQVPQGFSYMATACIS